MRVLVGCEFSGVVRDAFRRKGYDAWSCDIDPTEHNPDVHFEGDIFECLENRDWSWDLIILHPDCQKMACSGNRWWAGTKERVDQVEWTANLYNIAKRKAKRVALENPRWSVLWTRIGGRTQTIHPWEYGHRETKATGLKLHNLEPLVPTDIVGPPPPSGTEERKEWEKVWRMGPSKHYDRSKERARFLQGWADAMADQWGDL